MCFLTGKTFFLLQQDVLDFYIALSLCHTVQASEESDKESFYKYHYQVRTYQIMMSDDNDDDNVDNDDMIDNYDCAKD